jgi:intraflagellar transport protein 20
MDSSKIDVNITFDENNQIRVLAADKYRETENVKSETIDFLKKIMSFNDMVSTLIDVLDTQAEKIEVAKLKAVGARNKIEGEEDNRRKREQELKTTINEKRLQLER